MRRSLAVVATLAFLALVAVPVAAHGNSVRVDAQVSADGRVVVEGASSLTDGFVVVHRDDGGDPGEPIGHVPLAASDGFRQEFPVPIDDDVWADWGSNRSVWVAFHRDEGSDGFDPDEDPIQEGFGGPVVERATVGKGDAPARVLNERFEIPTELTTDAVALREVTADRKRRVVVRVENATGPVVGATTVGAGTQTNVTVPLDDAVFDRRGRRLTLYAHLTAGASNDSTAPLRVGGDPVGTAFPVRRVGDLEATATPTATPAGTPATDATPSPTPRPAPATEGPLVVTPSPTPTTTPTDAATTGDSGPGFGLLAVTVAVLAVGIWRRRER